MPRKRTAPPSSRPPNRIKQLRSARNHTLASLAQKIGGGASAGTVGKLERGDMELTYQWMRRLAAALDVSVAELLSEGFETGPSELPLVDLQQDWEAVTGQGVITSVAGVPVLHWDQSASYVVKRSQLKGVDKLLAVCDLVIIDPAFSELEAGCLYLVRGPDSQPHARVYLDGPARFEPFSTDSTLPSFKLGIDQAWAVGQIMQSANPFQINVHNLNA